MFLFLSTCIYNYKQQQQMTAASADGLLEPQGHHTHRHRPTKKQYYTVLPNELLIFKQASNLYLGVWFDSTLKFAQISYINK